MLGVFSYDVIYYTRAVVPIWCVATPWCVVLKFQGRRKCAFISFHFYWEKSKRFFPSYSSLKALALLRVETGTMTS